VVVVFCTAIEGGGPAGFTGNGCAIVRVGVAIETGRCGALGVAGEGNTVCTRAGTGGGGIELESGSTVGAFEGSLSVASGKNFFNVDVLDLLSLTDPFNRTFFMLPSGCPAGSTCISSSAAAATDRPRPPPTPVISRGPLGSADCIGWVRGRTARLGAKGISVKVGTTGVDFVGNLCRGNTISQTGLLDKNGGRTCFIPPALAFSLTSTGERDLDLDADLERSLSPCPDRLE